MIKSSHSAKHSLNNLYNIIFALFLGFLAHYSQIEQLITLAQCIADLFLKFLQLMSAPIVFLAIITNFLSISAQNHLKVYGQKVLFYTILTTISAATLACILFYLVEPAVYLQNSAQSLTSMADLSGIPANLMDQSSKINPNYYQELFKLIPNNIVKAFADNNILGVALIAAIMGFAMMQVPKNQQEHLGIVFSGLFHTFINIARYIITFLPLGVWAFTVLFFQAMQHNDLFANNLGKYVFVVIAANLIQGFIVLPLLLLYKKRSPGKLFNSVYPALMTAFFSKSSSATLPLTMDCMIEKHGTKEEIARFALPICTIINMNGCAAFIYTTVIFVGLQSGLYFSGLDCIIWILLATIIAIGNASIPMGCYFLSSAVLVGMGASLDLMLLILPIYTLFDMIETALNVWSDCCVTELVSK